MNNNKPTRLKFDRYYRAELFATQGDTGRTFALEVLDDYNKPLDLTGASLRLYVGAGDEVTYADGTIDDAEKGKASVTLYNSQLKFPGKQKAQFVLTGADGHKIGSKIFDLYVEKELAAGPTLGKNLYVDFETVEKTLKLIEAYDKSLEIGRELDHALKVKIEEGTDAKNSLADTTLKALKVKTDVENTTQAATTEKDALNKLKGESETLRDDLTRENRVAANNFTNLTNKITAGDKTTRDLAAATETAGNAGSSLTETTEAATAAEKTLKETNAAAEATRKNLSAANNTGGTLSAELSEKISTGGALKGGLDDSIAEASNKKSTLDETIKTAESREGTLKAADTEAQDTEALIRELMGQLKATESKVSEIIDKGDLNKFATKKDLEGIDVTSQLAEYAKKEEIGDKVVGVTQSEYDKLVSDGKVEDGTFYFVFEE